MNRKDRDKQAQQNKFYACSKSQAKRLAAQQQPTTGTVPPLGPLSGTVPLTSQEATHGTLISKHR